MIHYQKDKLTAGYDYIIDGQTVTTKEKLFVVFSKLFSFPDDFGNNWDSFFDCIRFADFSNSKSVKIYFENFNYFLQNESAEQKSIFLDVLKDLDVFWNSDFEIGKPWGHQKIDFSIIIHSL